MYELSVVIPIYNVEKYVAQCLDSIVNQSIGIENIEVIIVNDATPDNSMEIVEKYASKYSSIKIINNEENLGLGESRNRGLNEVTSDYVTFVDSDDFLSENVYENSIKKIKSSNSDLLIYNWEFYREDGEIEPFSIHKPHFKEDMIIEDFRQYPDFIFMTSAWNKIYHKKLFQYLKFPKSKYEDNGVTIETFINANQIYFNNEVTYFYRKNKDSITQVITMSNIEGLVDSINTLNELILKYPDYEMSITSLIIKFVDDILFWLCDYEWFVDEELKAINLLQSVTYNITNENLDFFNENISFSLLFEGDIRSLNKYDDETFLAKFKYFNRLPKVNSIANLYVDAGEGFNEDNKIAINYRLSRENLLSFDLKNFKNIHSLRFDPIEGAFSKVKILDISPDLKILSSNSENGINEEYQIFTTLDPSYIIEAKDVDEIRIRFKLSILNDEELSSLFVDKNNLINELNNQKEESKKKKGLFGFIR